MLNDKIKKDLLKKVDNVDIDVSELESAEWVRNIYGVEPQYAVGGYEYDEDELFAEQVNYVAEWVKQDGLCEVVDLSDEEAEDENLSLEAYNWLLSLV